MKYLLIILIPIALILIYATLPWVAIGMHSFFLPSPPMPEINYGEFPFKLVYEVNGEQKVIEDTLICEYDGIVVGSGEKFLKWKSWLDSGKNSIVLLEVKNPPREDKHGRKIKSRSIVYWLAPTEIHMGAQRKSYYEKFEYTFPDAACYDVLDGGAISNKRISADELLEEYGIRLISWEIAPPIVNSFR